MINQFIEEAYHNKFTPQFSSAAIAITKPIKPVPFHLECKHTKLKVCHCNNFTTLKDPQQSALTRILQLSLEGITPQDLNQTNRIAQYQIERIKALQELDSEI